MSRILALALILINAPFAFDGPLRAWAEGSLVEIRPEEALDYVGRSARVRMTVRFIGRAKQQYTLNSIGTYREPDNFTAQVSASAMQALVKQGVNDPVADLMNRIIEVTGRIERSNPGGLERARVLVTKASQIRLLPSTSDTPSRLDTHEVQSLADLSGRNVELIFRSGKKRGNIRIKKVESDELPGSAKAIWAAFRQQPAVRLNAVDVKEILFAGYPLGVLFDDRSGTLRIDGEKRASLRNERKKMEKRVRDSGAKIWPWLSVQERAEWLRRHREFAKTVQSRYPQLNLQVFETEYYLLVTDLDQGSSKKYLGYLDQMYEKMSVAFDVPVGRNVWCGKCVVVALNHQRDYMRFESEVMQNPRDDLHTSGGLCHSGSSGRVTIAVWKGDDLDAFAHKLVHETSHGFVWRMHSTSPLPAWLNEGLADWMAQYIVKTPGLLTKRQERAAQTAREKRSLNGIMTSNRLPREYFGAGSAMVDLLIKKDAAAFRHFFVGIKSGMDPEHSLRIHFGLSYQQLANLYGRSVKIPNLSL